MTSILILKTGALGDVLRTTSILSGLHERYPQCRVTWVTAPGAVDLVRLHPLVERVVPLDVQRVDALEAVRAELSITTWDRLLSFDDEEPMCRLASQIPTKRLSGAHCASDGRRVYTPDVAPWFDMGLLSAYGKEQADRLKVVNRRSHPAIFAEMLGIPMGRPLLPLEPSAVDRAEQFAARNELGSNGPVIGLNTGAGGRWTSKALPVERVVHLVHSLAAILEGKATFVLLGGPEEAERNRTIADGVGRLARIIDSGTDHSLLEFAAIVSRCDVVVTSDSLALHVAVARGLLVVAFFAPTSAAEIELYERGEKVVSTAPDACSYRRDADTSTLTAARLAAAVLSLLGR